MRRVVIVDGTSQEMAIQSLITLANQYDEPCTAKFNDIKIVAHPGDRTADIQSRYPDLDAVHLPNRPSLADRI